MQHGNLFRERHLGDQFVGSLVRRLRGIEPGAFKCRCLRPGAREWYLAWLRRTRPALVPHYRALFRAGAYSPAAYQEDVAARVRAMAERHGIGLRDSATARQVEQAPPAPEPPTQLTLL